MHKVVAGNAHSCAIKSDGTVRCWGNDASYQLGDGDASTTDRFTANIVTGLTNVISIAASYGNTCAVKSDGSVRCR